MQELPRLFVSAIAGLIVFVITSFITRFIPSFFTRVIIALIAIALAAILYFVLLPRVIPTTNTDESAPVVGIDFPRTDQRLDMNCQSMIPDVGYYGCTFNAWGLVTANKQMNLFLLFQFSMFPERGACLFQSSFLILGRNKEQQDWLLTVITPASILLEEGDKFHLYVILAIGNPNQSFVGQCGILNAKQDLGIEILARSEIVRDLIAKPLYPKRR